MKEQIPVYTKEAQRLTSKPQTPYSKAGDIFMSQPGNPEGPQQVNNPAPDIEKFSPALKRALSDIKEEGPREPRKPLDEKRMEQLKKAWDSYYRDYLKVDPEKLSQEEKRSLNDVMQHGGLPPMGGRAEPISTDGIMRIELLRIAKEINEEAARIGTREFPSDYLIKQRERVERLRDQGLFATPAEERESLDLLNRINERIDDAREKEAELTRDIYGRKTKEPKPTNLTAEDASELNPEGYGQDPLHSHPRVKVIATEVKEEIGRGKANQEFLKEKIDELFSIHDELSRTETMGTEGQKAAEEASRLLGEVNRLRELLSAKEREARLDAYHSEWSSYGEIRMLPDEKRELVLLALKGTSESERMIEQQFNRLFARADARSNDAWDEALGSAGKIEVDEFITALTTVASGRLTLDRKALKPEQKGTVDRIVRKLAQESQLRKYLHDITYYVNRNFATEDLHKAITQFASQEADLAYRIKGVTAVGHFFEQAMYEVIVKNAGYLPYESMINGIDGTVGEVEQLVRDQIDEAKNVGALPKDMEGWEIDRAISMARGMGIISGRMIEIAAQYGLPRKSPLTGWWANSIIKKLAYFRQVMRYDIGKERNKFLAFRLEGGSPFWDKKELTEILALSTEEILDRFVNEDNQDRYIDKINPFYGGGIDTQTKWRYQDDVINHAGAIARLLDGYPLNPLIGAGIWIEKERLNLKSTERLRDERGNPKIDIIFGQRVTTVGEKAKVIIKKNLELAAQITPLKLFYNMMGLRQQVLRNHYQNSFTEEMKITKSGEEKPSGLITITDKNFLGDLKTLSVVQEKILDKRSKSYEQFLKERKKYLEDKSEDPNYDPNNEHEPKAPDLYSQYVDLDAEIQNLVTEGVLPQEQATRLLTLTRNIRDEFNKPNQKDRLVTNLKDKGWKIPFVFGTDDLPRHLYEYAKTGPDSYGRRWGDINSIAKATEVYEQLIMNMPNFKSQDEIIKSLFELYNTLRGHDEGVTREVLLRTIEGVIKFFKKDTLGRLPLGIGMVKGQISNVSYAQVAFGPDKMAWDELDIDTFIKKARGAGLILSDDIELLKRRTGSAWWNILTAILRTSVPLVLASGIYYLGSKEIEGLGKAA